MNQHVPRHSHGKNDRTITLTVDVAQVAGAVQAVHAGLGEFGKVADVVQPGGGLQQLGVSAEGSGKAAGAGGDALDMGPAAGQGSFEQGVGEAFGPRG